MGFRVDLEWVRTRHELKTFCRHANIATLIHRTRTSGWNILQIPLFNMRRQPVAFIPEIPYNLHSVRFMASRTFRITEHKSTKYVKTSEIKYDEV